MNKELISILIPVYNRESLIEETVKNSMKQTYENIEIIIVDNKSTDNTWNILCGLSKLDKRIKIFQNECNIGPVKNWKRCLDESKGEYVKVLWSDDLIEDDFITKTLPYLKNNSDVGFVFTGVELFPKTDILPFEILKTGKYDMDIFLDAVLFNTNRFAISPGCSLFRRSDLKEALFINIPNKIGSDFSMHAIGNDILIFLYLTTKYDCFAVIEDKLSLFRDHNDSISIATKKSKLHLLYAVMKAHFIETYGTKKMLNKFNGILLILLIIYRSNDLKLNKISDFYLTNKNYKIDIYFTFTWIISQFYVYIKKRIKKIL